MSRFDRNPPNRRPLPDKPRRVTGGAKLMRLTPEDRHWASQRWIRILEEGVDGAVFIEGIDYAQLGQTRSVEIKTGMVTAAIQGRRRMAHTVELKINTFPQPVWNLITDAVIEDPSLAAPLLVGNLPLTVEDAFSAQQKSLLPRSLEEIEPNCTCIGTEGRWCWHAVCAARLAADVIHREPMSLFRLRGQEPVDFTERIRRRRATKGSAMGSTLAYSPAVNLPDMEEPTPIEACLEHFWEGEPDVFDHIDTTATRAEPTHALLRRLGPTPFTDVSFPLVGLLATCYDDIAHFASLGREERRAADARAAAEASASNDED